MKRRIQSRFGKDSGIMRSILIIEDDRPVAELERDYLEAAGYHAEICENGMDGLRMAEEGKYDLLILDITLPGISGFEICRAVRKTKDIPILMVSARKESMDVVRGLGVGADDYITKPFQPSELTARVQANLRMYDRLVRKFSGAVEPGDTIEAEGIVIHVPFREVQVQGKTVFLTNREFDLLLFLASSPGVVFSKETLYEHVWGMEAVGDPATVMVHVNRLREKLEEDPSKPRYIQTVWGTGYRFRK